MANTFEISGVRLNHSQLRALLSLPASNVSWPTYYALRRRGLIEGTMPQRLTPLGEEVIAGYKEQMRGSKT